MSKRKNRPSKSAVPQWLSMALCFVAAKIFISVTINIHIVAVVTMLLTMRINGLWP